MNYLTLVQILQALRIIFDIIIVWVLLYYVIRIVRNNSRTVQIFKGIAFIMIIQAVAKYFGFKTLAYITDNIVNWGFLALIIIFQPEIRGLLEKVGKTSVFNRFSTLSGSEKEDLVQVLMDSASILSESKTGALITIEQTNSLNNYISTGVQMNSIVTAELLCSLFQTTTPLHDGAVIIQGDRIAAASVYFPPTDLDLPSRYGARHRAAIGISEISDAVTIVISEETGRVAIAEQGKLIKMNERKLRAYLNRVILNQDTVAEERITPTPSESVSIDSLFNKEAENSFEETRELEFKEIEKEHVAPGQTDVVIIDETKDDDETFEDKNAIHIAEMKTFDKVNFHSEIQDNEIEEDNNLPVVYEQTPKEEKKEKKGLFQFLRKDKKSSVEKAVKEVVKDYSTQQLKLKEIQEANEKLEQTLSLAKKVTLPKSDKPNSKEVLGNENTIENTVENAQNTAPKVHSVNIAKIEVPQRQEIEITDLPPVKPIEITQVQRKKPKVTMYMTDEGEDKKGGDN